MIPWAKIAIGAAILSALTWLYIEIRKDGAESVRNAVERQNNAAASKADDDRSAFDRCPVGMWDYGARRCRGGSTRGRH